MSIIMHDRVREVARQINRVRGYGDLTAFVVREGRYTFTVESRHRVPETRVGTLRDGRLFFLGTSRKVPVA